MSIETYGRGQRLKVAARLVGKYFTREQLILLPVPTSRDNKYISDTDILLEDTLAGAKDGCFVVGYGLPEKFVRLAKERRAKILDLSHDEKYLTDNAYITALGALGYILTTDTRSPTDIKFGIVGYGRIGSSLVRMLLFLGAKVKVYTSRMPGRIELGEVGISSFSSADMRFGEGDAQDVDILINTAPKDMRGIFKGAIIPTGMRVLELASGKNFEGILGVENLPSLPEKMYPESAGRTYFEAVRRFLKSESGM